MTRKFLLLTFLLLLGNKEANCTLWKPFYTGMEELVNTQGTARGYIWSESLCLAWIDSKTEADVACYNVRNNLCCGYKLEFPVTGSGSTLVDWKCYSKKAVIYMYIVMYICIRVRCI